LGSGIYSGNDEKDNSVEEAYIEHKKNASAMVSIQVLKQNYLLRNFLISKLRFSLSFGSSFFEIYPS
jgi:hypothetical protein